MVKRPLILLFVLAAAVPALPAGSVGADGGSLQSVVDAASERDTIRVSAGIYDGNIVLRKRLAIIGEGKPVIRGSGSGSVITITADSCEVKGFVVERSGTRLVDEDAGILLKSGGNLIEDNHLRDVLFGIYLYSATGNSFIGNRVEGRPGLELGERGSGIHIWNSHHNQFRGNVITGSRDGFYIQNASHTLIEDNVSYGVRYGVHYMYADSNVFLRNQFYDNVAGAAIMYSDCIRFRHNVFSRNRGFASFGILFQDCTALEADSNVIADNVVGLFFEATRDNLFRHNVIARNDIALQMFQNSTGNLFAENNFLDNLTLLDIIGKRTQSHWSMGGHGNYWSSYDGYDLDGDGVGDVPMTIRNVFQYMEGRNANVRLYLYSPASQALAVAATAFPVIRVADEVDSAPLMRPVNLGSLEAVVNARATERGRPADLLAKAFLWMVLLVSGGLMYTFVYRTLAFPGKP